MTVFPFAGLLAAPALATPAPLPATSIPPADAELIALCAEHILNIDAYNADKSDLEPEENPLWAAYERTRDAISDARPQSIYGLLAKARAAVAEAAMLDGSLLWRSSTGADWAADLTLDLLRLGQAGALPALEAPPAPDQTSCFITLLAEVDAADAALNRAVVAHSRNEGAEAEVAAMEAAEARYEAAIHRLAAEPARDALGFAAKGLIVAREASDLLGHEGRMVADSLLADARRLIPGL